MSDLSNHRKKWTGKEVKQLMKEINTMNIDKIAKIHKRTSNAIYLKLVREAAIIASEDPDIKLNELCEIVGLSPSKLLEGFNKIRYYFEDPTENSDSDSYSDSNSDSNSNSNSDCDCENNDDDISEPESSNIENKKDIVYFTDTTAYCIIIINLLGWGYYCYNSYKKL